MKKINGYKIMLFTIGFAFMETLLLITMQIADAFKEPSTNVAATFYTFTCISVVVGLALANGEIGD